MLRSLNNFSFMNLYETGGGRIFQLDKICRFVGFYLFIYSDAGANAKNKG